MQEILKATSGELIQGCPNSKTSTVSIDSRKIDIGALFIAIKGEKFDGHTFIEQAIKNGATAIIVSKNIHKKLPDNIAIIKVKNT